MTKDDKQPFGHCPVEGCHLGVLKGMLTCGFHSARTLEQMGIYGKLAPKGELMELDADTIAKLRATVIVEDFKRDVEAWLAAVRHAGYIVRVDQVSDGPPAMGNHSDVVTVYEARK